LHLEAGVPEAEKYFVTGLKFFLLVPILKKTHFRRQITVDRFPGNQLSENRTVLPLLVQI
jgi:hypothetical protein